MTTTSWTVIIDQDTGELVEAFDQSDAVCGGGPHTCGGCRDCMVQQAEHYGYVVAIDVSDDDMRRLAERKAS